MYIVADIGGTKTRIAGSADLATLTDPVIVDTPQSYAEALSLIAATIRDICKDSEPEMVLMGVPVLLTPDKRAIEDATNLPDWTGRRIAEDVEREVGGSVVLENDVVLVGLGEAHFGAGVGAKILMYLTVSTGVNAVQIIDGEHNTDYIGHSTGLQYISIVEYPTGQQYISASNPLQTWEQMISGKSIEKRFGMHPKELGKEHEIWEELARTTAFGIYNSALHWYPDRVVLGGSMFNEVGIAVPRVAHHMKEINAAMHVLPELVHSKLGDVGGLWGGIARLKQLRQ